MADPVTALRVNPDMRTAVCFAGPRDCYDGGVALADLHPGLRRTLANLPRRLVGLFSQKLSPRWFGGYSILILAK